MHWKKLKEKYPDTWDKIYMDMIESLKSHMPVREVSRYNEGDPDNRLDVIAHNSAFLACITKHEEKMRSNRQINELLSTIKERLSDVNEEFKQVNKILKNGTK